MTKLRAGEQAKNLDKIKMEIQNYGDRINPDAVKNVAANACEEGILGLLLIYEEHRAAVAGGKVSLCEDDFFTDLGKRIFRNLQGVYGRLEDRCTGIHHCHHDDS